MIKQKVLVVGAGRLGREVLDFCEGAIDRDEWEIDGFLDDTMNPLEGYSIAYSVKGKICDFEPSPGIKLILAIGNPAAREKMFLMLKAKGATFLTMIHRTAYVSPSASIEEGAIIGPFASVSANARVGRCSLLNFYANVGHDAILGDFSVMCVHSNINGFSRVGSSVFIGGHGVVLPEVHVGNGAIIGAGSVAMRRVKDHVTVVGVPAEKFM